ncbi:hypothetical protein GGI12_001358 [Dipsacomyces acuminosporus]|nr:hypothetical protein GGI12_001358 [Dipsacomyces acuminosporus]
MAIETRPVELLVLGNSPLAGQEQHALREWIAEWTFDMHEFSDLAQPLIRGDIAALRRNHSSLIEHYAGEGYDEAECIERANEHYKCMRETRLRMPAMEVVIAGAQYYHQSTLASYTMDALSTEPQREHTERAAVNKCQGHLNSQLEYAQCIEFLCHHVGVYVDDEDVAGFTAFMRASQTCQSRLDLAQLLLDLGADVNHRSRFGGVALHEALMAQDRHAVAFLKRNGASMDIKDNDGVSPRDIVALIL